MKHTDSDSMNAGTQLVVTTQESNRRMQLQCSYRMSNLEDKRHRRCRTSKDRPARPHCDGPRR